MLEKESEMKVNNINGTSVNTCKCGSWLEHWKKFSKKSIPAACCVVGCTEKPEVGAHVQKDSATDRSWYIIPLCKKHNKETKSLDVSVLTTFVSANVNSTCG